ncbi:hypothetical protein GCM10007857_44690 [Bradyrhizobium iriomotense]|uniref:Uncharacterized protein n=1 Tax=Bradyrhizobium iriomotense TaxID=441950 RepID=A0ABQ6B6C6_9BRAD|nr:hypothetical protein GCM10007857_44690 [Bradyrhizobium iriomotense]
MPWSNVDLDERQRADRWNKIGKPKSKAGKRDIPLAPIAAAGGDDSDTTGTNDSVSAGAGSTN